MTELSNIVPFPNAGNEEWILSYQQTWLTKHDEATIDAYIRILRQFTAWVAKHASHNVANFGDDDLREWMG